MSLQVDYLGWAVFILTSPAGMRLVTDLHLSGNPRTKVPPSPVKPGDVHVDLVMVSHCTGDRSGQTLGTLASSDIIKLLGDHGTLCLVERAGYGGTWNPHMGLTISGATYVQGNFTTHAVDARRAAFRHLSDGSYMTGGPLCYITQVEDDSTCFFGRDTPLTYDMKLWGELLRPDMTFLGIGNVDLQGRSLDEMDPPAVMVYMEMLGVKTVIPIHYRTQEYPEQFQQYLTVCRPECHCLVMKAGGPVTL